MSINLTKKQIEAIRCAHADLTGALEANEQMDTHAHDWKSHGRTIQDLEREFPDLLFDCSMPEVSLNIPKEKNESGAKFKVGDMVGYDPGLEPCNMRHGVVIKVVDRGEKEKPQNRFRYDCSLFKCDGKYDSIYPNVSEAFLS